MASILSNLAHRYAIFLCSLNFEIYSLVGQLTMSNPSRTEGNHMLHFRYPKNPTNHSQPITLPVIFFVIISVEMPVNVTVPLNIEFSGGATTPFNNGGSFRQCFNLRVQHYKPMLQGATLENHTFCRSSADSRLKLRIHLPCRRNSTISLRFL